MSAFALAVERKQWELVSLCLLVAVTEAAAALPPGAVEGLLEVLAGLDVEGGRAMPAGRQARGGRRGRRR